MRRQGRYIAGQVPTFSSLVNASTDKRAELMRPLTRRVTNASGRYELQVPNVHVLRSSINKKAEKAAMIDGYDGRTVEMKRLLATMLDSLPEENADLCPYCSLDSNPELDHFLPKTKFPEFSLYGHNLIPICSACNRKKSNSIKTLNGDRIFLNPAHEPSIENTILTASLGYPRGSPLATFWIEDYGRLPAPELATARRHFERLGLAGRYRKRAHGVLSAIKSSTKNSSPAGRRRVVENMVENAPFGQPTNSWEPALAQAIQYDIASLLVWLNTP